MDREIKFRAFDKTKKEMHYDRTFSVVEPESLDDVDFEVKHVSFNGALYTITQSSWGGGDNEPEFISHDFEIMQYTGLRDNKSVDIYDGDIVEVDYRGLKNNIFTVYFGDYMSEKYHMVCWLLKNDEDLIPLSLAVPCKVIGNIYEHPYLLEPNQ